MSSVNEQQQRFIEDEFFNCTIRAAFQRAHIYTPETGENARGRLREALRSSLAQIASRYCEVVTEEDHIKNIVSLSEALSKEHTAALVDGRFRIGIAQKALNLYLKYLWCLGKVSTPPHCPFDGVMIEKLAGCDEISWTKFDSLEEYEKLVQAAKKEAGAKPLAEWELEAYDG